MPRHDRHTPRPTRAHRRSRARINRRRERAHPPLDRRLPGFRARKRQRQRPDVQQQPDRPRTFEAWLNGFGLTTRPDPATRDKVSTRLHTLGVTAADFRRSIDACHICGDRPPAHVAIPRTNVDPTRLLREPLIAICNGCWRARGPVLRRVLDPDSQQPHDGTVVPEPERGGFSAA